MLSVSPVLFHTRQLTSPAGFQLQTPFLLLQLTYVVHVVQIGWDLFQCCFMCVLSDMLYCKLASSSCSCFVNSQTFAKFRFLVTKSVCAELMKMPTRLYFIGVWCASLLSHL